MTIPTFRYCFRDVRMNIPTFDDLISLAFSFFTVIFAVSIGYCQRDKDL